MVWRKLVLRPLLAGLNKFSSAKDELILVRRDPRLDAVLAAKLLDRSSKLLRLSADNLRAAMSEDGAPNTFGFAPAKLLDDGRVANHSPVPFANHRPTKCCAVADIEVLPSQSGDPPGKRLIWARNPGSWAVQSASH